MMLKYQPSVFMSARRMSVVGVAIAAVASCKPEQRSVTGLPQVPRSFVAQVMTSATADWPNEPPGHQEIVWYNGDCRPANPGGCGETGFWYWDSGDSLNMTSVTVSDAPTSTRDAGQNVLQTRYPANLAGGTTPVHLVGWISTISHIPNPHYTQVYVSFWIRFVGSTYEAYPGTNKFGFFGFGSGSGCDYSNDGFFDLRPAQQGGSQGVIVDQLNLQFQEQTPVARQIVTSVNIPVGSWHRWELVMRANDLGSANGLFRWWQDGVLIADYADVVYLTAGNTHTFYSYTWFPYWGGGTGPIKSSRDDYVQTDQLYISGLPDPNPPPSCP